MFCRMPYTSETNFYLVLNYFKRLLYLMVQTTNFQENLEKTKPERIEENKEDMLHRKEISQEYVKETWRNIILIQ